MLSKSLALIFLLACSQSALSADLLPVSQDRLDMIRRADVWFSPDWISSDFQFSSKLDVLNGPVRTETDALLMQDHVFCQFRPRDAGSQTGATPKFFCNLLKQNSDNTFSPVVNPTGKPTKIKVKFGATNTEVFGEVLASRLFWALGFGADRMFFVPTTYCFGCSSNPFKNQNVDPSSINQPRAFTPTAIERKFPGTAILKYEYRNVMTAGPQKSAANTRKKAIAVQGWNFAELQSLTNTEEQKTQRDALLLLAIFVNHSDNKQINHRLVCVDALDANGQCTGRTAMIVQDLGATFGGGASGLKIVRANYNAWSQKSIWKNPKTCQAQVSYWFTQDMKTAQVSERGRQFLLKLLLGFSSGSEGRKRVEDLFRAARIEMNDEATIEMWTDAFMAKVKEIQYPMGEENKDFTCPGSP